MKEDITALISSIEKIDKIAKETKIEEDIKKALDLVEKIESQHNTSDILYDEWKSLIMISDSLYNLRLQVKDIESRLTKE